MTSLLSALPVVGAALTLSLVAITAAPTPASAADIACFVGRGDTTYRVAPQAGKVRVVVDYLAMNRCRDYRLIGWQFSWILITRRVRSQALQLPTTPDPSRMAQ